MLGFDAAASGIERLCFSSGDVELPHTGRARSSSAAAASCAEKGQERGALAELLRTSRKGLEKARTLTMFEVSTGFCVSSSVGIMTFGCAF